MFCKGFDILYHLKIYLPIEDVYVSLIYHIHKKRQLEGEHWTNNMYIAAKQARFKLKKKHSKDRDSFDKWISFAGWLIKSGLFEMLLSAGFYSFWKTYSQIFMAIIFIYGLFWGFFWQE